MNLAISDPFKAIHSQILQAPTEVGYDLIMHSE